MGQRLLIAIAFVLQGVCVVAQVAIRATNRENTTAVEESALRHSNPMFVINAGDKTLQIPPAMESRHSFSLDLPDIDGHWIQSIAVIKGQEAIDRYGALGQYGVVIVELKANAFQKMPAHLAERFKIR
jgi:hypothetical protein